MVITDTPRSLAMSFIRVLMIVIQYIEPSGSDPLFTMTLAKEPNGFSLNCELLVPKQFLWPSAISLLTSVTLPIIVLCLSTDPRVSCLGGTANTARKTLDSDHGIMRSSG